MPVPDDRRRDDGGAACAAPSPAAAAPAALQIDMELGKGELHRRQVVVASGRARPLCQRDRQHRGGCGGARRAAAQLLEGLPPATGGLALGLCGLCGLLIELQRLDVHVEQLAYLQPIVSMASVLALVLVALVCARIVLCTHQVRKELREPAAIAAYVACVFALMLICSRNVGALAGDRAARTLVTALLVPIGALVVLFVQRCWRTGTPPEPFYNPPTNPAVFLLAGVSVGVSPWLLMSCFVIGVAQGFSIVPVEAVRTLRQPQHVAANMSIWILQAPGSVNAVMWGLLRRDAVVISSTAPWLSGALDGISHALFAYSVLLFSLTLVATWQRRNAISAQGFSGSWAALTFPSCSTAIAALHYSCLDGGSAGPMDQPMWVQRPLQIYALVLAALASVLVVAVTAAFIKQQLNRIRLLSRVHPLTRPATDDATAGSELPSKDVQEHNQLPLSNDNDGSDGTSESEKDEPDPEQPPFPLIASGSLVFDDPDSPRADDDKEKEEEEDRTVAVFDL